MNPYIYIYIYIFPILILPRPIWAGWAGPDPIFFGSGGVVVGGWGGGGQPTPPGPAQPSSLQESRPPG